MEQDVIKKQLASIQELEEQLAKADSINKKNKIKLQLYKELLQVKRTIPYLLITSITFGGFSLFLSVPFYRENKHKELWYKKEIDSLGNIAIEEQYEPYNSLNEVSFVSSWKKYDDTYYYRNITTYFVNSFTEEEIEKLVNDEDISLANILNGPVISKVEKKNNLTEEELKEDGFIEAKIYNENINEFIIVKEDRKDNNIYTVLYLLLIAACSAVYTVINMYGQEEKAAIIKRLEKKYAPIDVEELKRKLEVRKDTYERLQ